MTNRENPVWQMAYAVEFTRQLRDFLRSNPWPSDKHLADMRGDSETVADAAVEALGEQRPQPATPPQPRDESRDVWISGPVTSQTEFAAGERYVPYSQLEAEQADVARLKSALNRDRTGLAAALERINRTCVGYRWIPEGEWASYDYTQQTKETLRTEIGNCLDAVCDIATRAIRNEPSDAELLDAILEAAQNLGDVSALNLVWKAIAERAKR